MLSAKAAHTSAMEALMQKTTLSFSGQGYGFWTALDRLQSWPVPSSTECAGSETETMTPANFYTLKTVCSKNGEKDHL